METLNIFYILTKANTSNELRNYLPGNINRLIFIGLQHFHISFLHENFENLPKHRECWFTINVAINLELY